MRLRRTSTRLWLLLTALLVAVSCSALAPGAARADQSEVTILEDDPLVLSNPTGTLLQARELGVNTLRLKVPWAAVAPHTSSWTRPSFDATDPRAYGSGAWAPYDAVIVEAHSLGITVDLDLAPGAPRWATGRGQPKKTKGYPFWQWEPDASQFGLFAQAAGERYSGNWDPVTDRLDPGNPQDLPRVSFWSVWNEPNYGPSLAPQALPGHKGVEDSPRMYRSLVDNAWEGLARSGHTTPVDTIIIGELAPRSQLTSPGAFTDFNGMTPLVFLQNLYCLSASYQPLRGAAAAIRGCPATAGGSRRFVADNPGLFDNSGVSDHPYDEFFAPDQELDIPRLKGWAQENTQDTSLATIDVLEHGLDRVTAAYGDHEQLPIWDTEYGYVTSPPHRIWSHDTRPWPSPANAAFYDNWAEYLHWKNPRIKSFAQYLIQDPLPATPADNYGSFSSGLVTFHGADKADYTAFRMPLYLPHTTAGSSGQALQVWGAARPAPFAVGSSVSGANASASQTVRLLYKRLGSRSWTTLTALPLSTRGYYDAYIRFPASGTLMAQWTVPGDTLLGPLSGRALDSRRVRVTVR